MSLRTRGNITANAYRNQAYQFDLAHRMNAVTGKESYLYDGRLLQDWSNRRQVRNGYIYMSYTPYGQPTLPMDGVGYTGHFVDVGTQLTYMQQRYYDPAIGRFLSIDPVAVGTSETSNFNRYRYAGNNPFRNVDPDGRFEQPFALPAGLQAVAGVKTEADAKAFSRPEKPPPFPGP